MKHIKWDFSLNAWVISLGGLMGFGQWPKIVFSRLLHIKLKEMKCTESYKQIFCLNTNTCPLGWGQKVKTVFFLKVVLLH